MSGLYADLEGKGGADRHPDGHRRLRRQGAGPAGRAADGRPPEQGRHRRLEGARVDRHRGRDDDLRRHQLRHRAGHGQGGAGEEAGVLHQRRRHFGADQRRNAAPTPCTMPTTPSRWPRAPAARWWRGRQELVLPDGRLRLRPRARSRHRHGRQGQGRHGGRRVRHRSMRRTSRPSCCRRRTPRRRSWAWPTPAATPSTRSRRPRNSASTRR